MVITTRKILVCVIGLILAYIGWRVYVNFFYTGQPSITIAGLSEQTYYSGNVDCQINIACRAKLNSIKIVLDDSIVLPNVHAQSYSLNQSFILATKALSNGPHTFKIEATDITRNHNKGTLVVPFYVDNLPLQVAFSHSENEFKIPQGKTFHLALATNKPLKRVSVILFSREFIAVPESERALLYECFIPIECEEKPSENPFTIMVEDFVGNRTELAGHMQVVPFAFKNQILHHIDSAQFAEERKLGRADKELRDLLAEIAAKSPKNKLWHGTFYIPLNSKWVITEFGTKRISQERGCYTHAAIDMVGPSPRTVVWAPQDGIVVIKDRFEVNGNTVVIDHGCGVISLLCHFDQFADITVGDKIRRGSPVGFTGKTGYATGDHLHWEMRVNNVNVDPLQWTKMDF